MSEPTLGVVAVGNAMVDVLTQSTDEFVELQSAKHGIIKGSMALVDAARAVEIYGQMGPGVEESGGSAANTIAGIASFGGKSGFIGKVADDQLGKVFTHDVRSLGVKYSTPPLLESTPTGCCLILVTPDAERTMMTFLGAGESLSSDDADSELIADAQVLYLEGYAFDKPTVKETFIVASQHAHAARRKVALTLSDSFCVERHREGFQPLIESHIDILFANEDEIVSLYQSESFDKAKKAISDKVELAVLTQGEKGAVIVTATEEIHLDAQPVAEVVDTTGAGDQFAAGFLYGYTQGMELARCGELGAKAAAQIISHIGSRPSKPFSELL